MHSKLSGKRQIRKTGVAKTIDPTDILSVIGLSERETPPPKKKLFHIPRLITQKTFAYNVGTPKVSKSSNNSS